MNTSPFEGGLRTGLQDRDAVRIGNQTRLQLFTLAYNLANFLRRLALPRAVKHW